VGNTFLLLTSIKLIAIYVIARPILEKEEGMEKWNLFVLFMIYLLVETTVTIRLLNEKN
jgi:hypothetical protein